MEKIIAISAITLIATIMVVGVIAPALAAQPNPIPGSDRVTICHFNQVTEVPSEMTIPQKAADKHLENHTDPQDTVGSCPAD